MSHVPAIRTAFATRLRQLEQSFKVPGCPIQFPETFWDNLQAAWRRDAYDHAVAVAARALRIQAERATDQDIERVRSTVRRAGIRYLPAEQLTVEYEDGCSVNVTAPATAVLETEPKARVIEAERAGHAEEIANLNMRRERERRAMINHLLDKASV